MSERKLTKIMHKIVNYVPWQSKEITEDEFRVLDEANGQQLAQIAYKSRLNFSRFIKNADKLIDEFNERMILGHIKEVQGLKRSLQMPNTFEKVKQHRPENEEREIEEAVVPALIQRQPSDLMDIGRELLRRNLLTQNQPANLTKTIPESEQTFASRIYNQTDSELPSLHRNIVQIPPQIDSITMHEEEVPQRPALNLIDDLDDLPILHNRDLARLGMFDGEHGSKIYETIQNQNDQLVPLDDIHELPLPPRPLSLLEPSQNVSEVPQLLNEQPQSIKEPSNIILADVSNPLQQPFVLQPQNQSIQPQQVQLQDQSIQPQQVQLQNQSTQPEQVQPQEKDQQQEQKDILAERYESFRKAVEEGNRILERTRRRNRRRPAQRPQTPEDQNIVQLIKPIANVARKKLRKRSRAHIPLKSIKRINIGSDMFDDIEIYIANFLPFDEDLPVQQQQDISLPLPMEQAQEQQQSTVQAQEQQQSTVQAQEQQQSTVQTQEQQQSTMQEQQQQQDILMPEPMEIQEENQLQSTVQDQEQQQSTMQQQQQNISLPQQMEAMEVGKQQQPTVQEEINITFIHPDLRPKPVTSTPLIHGSKRSNVSPDISRVSKRLRQSNDEPNQIESNPISEMPLLPESFPQPHQQSELTSIDQIRNVSRPQVTPIHPSIDLHVQPDSIDVSKIEFLTKQRGRILNPRKQLEPRISLLGAYSTLSDREAQKTSHLNIISMEEILLPRHTAPPALMHEKIQENLNVLQPICDESNQMLSATQTIRSRKTRTKNQKSVNTEESGSLIETIENGTKIYSLTNQYEEDGEHPKFTEYQLDVCALYLQVRVLMKKHKGSRQWKMRVQELLDLGVTLSASKSKRAIHACLSMLTKIGFFIGTWSNDSKSLIEIEIPLNRRETSSEKEN